MKTLLILVASSLLVACAEQRDMPAFPFDLVKTQYALISANDGTLRCIEYDIVSHNPYKIKRKAIYTNLAACDGVGGYKPQAFISIKNWADDMGAWAADRECKLK